MKRVKTLNIRLLAILLVVGGALLYYSAGDFFISIKPAVDLNELNADEVKPGMKIETEIYAALDSFASEETWTENKNGSKTPKKTSKNFVVIPVGEEEYMALEVGSQNFTKINTIMDNTYNYMTGASEELGDEVMAVTGGIYKLEPELDQYFTEWFSDVNYFGDGVDAEPYLVHYVLRYRDFNTVRIFFGVGVLALVLAVLHIVSVQASKKRANNDSVSDGMGGHMSSGTMDSMGMGNGDASAVPTQVPTQVPAQPVATGAPAAKPVSDDPFEGANKTDRDMN